MVSGYSSEKLGSDIDPLVYRDRVKVKEFSESGTTQEDELPHSEDGWYWNGESKLLNSDQEPPAEGPQRGGESLPYEPPFKDKMAFQLALLAWFERFSEPQLISRHWDELLAEVHFASSDPTKLKEQVRQELERQFAEEISGPLREILSDPKEGPAFLNTLHEFAGKPLALADVPFDEIPLDLRESLKRVYHRLMLWQRRRRRADLRFQQ
ncbi:MAG: hypothetical protein ACD_28C00111G0005 [uncultured bacterium]|nr:MAG: hypothetical protein ACD_28C00111G0005 [uncultured bacterium]KKT76301.1 MAG: hypothetical protein UW70_C0019G0019 [Candidatus Peregrinibacteria bacterium GW2011_GWA2_44_7]